MKYFKSALIVLASALMLFTFCACTKMQNQQQKKEVMLFVEKAVAFALVHGQKTAIKAFSNPKGKFVHGHLYIFGNIYKGKNKGLNITQGYQTKQYLGKNEYNLQDAKGKFMIREAITIAQEGGGWINYVWENPETQKLAKKHAYILPVPGKNYFLASGYYEK